MGLQHLSRELMRRCDALGGVSDDPGCLTRTFRSPAMARANALVGAWMREAGLDVREDAAFNLLGRWPSTRRGARTLLLGSHLDTVRDAGKYDGPMGVLTALAAVQHVRESGRALPFHVEVVGFSDEEGVRYQTTYLGSGAMAGTLSRRELSRIDEKGIERARRRRGELLAYVEAHIEQGPVLERCGLPVGVVTAITGQSRIRVELQGRAGHAGTTPMDLRHDALCGAAEIVLAAEQSGLVKSSGVDESSRAADLSGVRGHGGLAESTGAAKPSRVAERTGVAERSGVGERSRVGERSGVVATVGQMSVAPGASNVIPGLVTFSLDVRHPSDARRRAAVRALKTRARAIARARGLRLTWTELQEAASVRCDAALTRLLSDAVTRQGLPVMRLPSGAGHDAAALAAICPVAMLFVRCRGGVSHNPAESIKRGDVERAIAVLADLIEALAGTSARSEA